MPRIYTPVLVALLLLSACDGVPRADGRWTGIATPPSGNGFFYALDLKSLGADSVTGRGFVSVYTLQGEKADSTYVVAVQGRQQSNTLELEIVGPFPSAPGIVHGVLKARISKDAESLYGTFESDFTGEVPLVLSRVVEP